MKKNWIVCLLLAQATWLSAGSDSGKWMEEAITAYQQADYEGAIALYESVLASGQHSTGVYFNLGNACYKAGHLGKAVLNYERALLLDPYNKEVTENLNFVQQQIEPTVEAIPPFFLQAWWDSLRSVFSSTLWAAIGLLLLWLGAAGASLWLIGKTRERRKMGFKLGLTGFLLCVLPLLLAFSRKKTETDSSFAIILTDNSILRVAPSEESEERMTLKEGWKVECVDELANWFKVKLANGEMGWIKMTNLEQL
jgi:tetratricopeptide (TPR) repeat protein